MCVRACVRVCVCPCGRVDVSGRECVCVCACLHARECVYVCVPACQCVRMVLFTVDVAHLIGDIIECPLSSHGDNEYNYHTSIDDRMSAAVLTCRVPSKSVVVI